MIRRYKDEAIYYLDILIQTMRYNVAEQINSGLWAGLFVLLECHITEVFSYYLEIFSLPEGKVIFSEIPLTEDYHNILYHTHDRDIRLLDLF